MKFKENIFIHTPGRRKTFIVWSLALLMVLFSCPLKKAFHLSQAQTSSAPAKSLIPVNSGSQTALAQKNASCCFVKADSKWNIQQKKVNIPAPFVTENIYESSGFGIFHVLSMDDEKLFANPVLTVHSLPLFLQHSSLLI